MGKEMTLTEPQPSYLPVSLHTRFPCIIDKMYWEKCVELRALILLAFCAVEALK